jgi:hypothetical protein
MRNGDIAADADILIAATAPDRTGGTEDTITKWLKLHELEEEQARADHLLILV